MDTVSDTAFSAVITVIEGFNGVAFFDKVTEKSVWIQALSI